MTEIKKDDDAGEQAPKPKAPEAGKTGGSSDKHDAKNHDDPKDGDRSVPVEDMNSANDE